MAENLFDTYRKYFNEGFILAVASNAAKEAEISKIKIRPVKLKAGLVFQTTSTKGTQEIHANLTADEAAKLLEKVTGEFRQIEIKNGTAALTALVSKKGRVTVKEHISAAAGRRPAGESADGRPETPGGQEPGRQQDMSADTAGSHNRKKNHVLEEGTPVPFLVELGVMTPAGRVVASKYDKFKQINRYLEFVEDIVPSLPQDREISIIDFGCGKSYLTFALYYYLHEVRGLNIRVTGLDLKKDVISHCSELAKRFGYDRLEFLHGDIADYTGRDSVDMVVTLHACDTATDWALYKAIKWGARVIFCVPCCQHELNGQLKSEVCRDLFRYGLIKERMAALMTDALRADILEEQGYRTQILEFIDMEHTPKNILIRAVRQPLKIRGGSSYVKLMEETGAVPTLYRLLHDGQ